MRTRLSFLVVVVSLVLPTGLRASGHWYAAAATPSIDTGQSKLWGGSLSGEKVLSKKNWTWLADFGAHSGAHDTTTLTQYSALTGLRYTKPLVYKLDRYAFQPFAHVLGGFVHTNDKAANSSEWAGAFGGGVGVDYVFAPSGGLRGQVDYVSFWPDSGRDSFVRLSVGLVYRFEKH
jgi:hypothetical protein